MADREKIINGLECCTTMDEYGYPSCEKCPYSDVDGTCPNIDALHRDALELLKDNETQLIYRDEIIKAHEAEIERLNELLKEQEPKLLTIEEITGDGECWFEGINGAYGYADCYMCTGIKEVEVHRISMKPEYVLWDDFKKKWRCWSYRPTDEQRKAAKWE